MRGIHGLVALLSLSVCCAAQAGAGAKGLVAVERKLDRVLSSLQAHRSAIDTRLTRLEERVDRLGAALERLARSQDAMLVELTNYADTRSTDAPRRGTDKAAAPLAFDPRRELKPLPRPDHVLPREHLKLVALVASLRGGGADAEAAKKKLLEAGNRGLGPIINQLRLLDYREADDTRLGEQLNRLLTELSGGVINAGYRPCGPGETVKPEDAVWNAKTLKAWYRFYEKYSDGDALERLVRARKRKAKG